MTSAEASNASRPDTVIRQGRAGDSLFGIRRLLRRGHDHHSPRSWVPLLAGLDAGDTADEQLARTWIAAQELRLLSSSPDRRFRNFHNYHNYRLRLLLHCGVDWNTIRATPIRGRLPRFAA
jgi:hypothetical protein